MCPNMILLLATSSIGNDISVTEVDITDANRPINEVLHLQGWYSNHLNLKYFSFSGLTQIDVNMPAKDLSPPYIVIAVVDNPDPEEIKKKAATDNRILRFMASGAFTASATMQKEGIKKKLLLSINKDDLYYIIILLKEKTKYLKAFVM